MKLHVKRITRSLIVILAVITLANSIWAGVLADSSTPPVPAAASDTTNLYLPAIYDNDPWPSPFGIEATSLIDPGGILLSRAVAIKTRWARIGDQVQWNLLQPVEGNPATLDFASLLPDLNSELIAMSSAKITPVVTVNRTPAWAAVYPDKTCSAIRSDKYAAFASFMQALIKFYSKPPYNVHNWELGNEPDIDPSLAPADAGYGCWGRISDTQYYGGRAYGDMLKIVAPVMRSADPQVRIWVGGLLLDSPNSVVNGKPEYFLRGILEAGGGPYFDVVSYHWHPSYYGSKMDYDLYSNPWESRGGGTVGKARFIRQELAARGQTKQIFLNETGFGCKVEGNETLCATPGEDFFDIQAEQLVRSVTRALSEQLLGFNWYTLNGPGWRNSGLLDYTQTPRQSYQAYQVLSQQLDYAYYQTPVDFGDAEIEAYQFRRDPKSVIVVWTKSNVQGKVVNIPAAKNPNVYSLDGTLVTGLPTVGANIQVPVGFSPVYIVRDP